MRTRIKWLRDADPRILNYAEDVLTGKQIASRKVYAACERFIADLRQVGKAKYPWTFDAERASRPIRFKEKFLRPAAGDYEKFEELPWQCFFDGNCYGWLDKKTGLRRFQHVLLIVGSGNGKTGLVSGNALYDGCQTGALGMDIIVFANSKEQSAILLEDCRRMVESSPDMQRIYRTYRSEIINRKDRTRILNKSADASALDGLRPAEVIYDELHAQKDFKLVNQGVRSLRKYPDQRQMIISTMGTVLDGPLVHEYRLADEMLKGLGSQDANDRFFALVYELDEEDDVEDSRLWVKANPSLGKLLSQKDLETSWETARMVPQLRSDFLNKTLNIFTKADEASFLDFEVLKRCRDTVAPETLNGRTAYGGIDVSASQDHCSAALEIPLEDGRLFVLTHTWVPRKVAEADKERLPYYEYQMLGLITIIDGDYVRGEYIIGWFEKMAEKYQIDCIGYDPANATILVNQLRLKFSCDPVRQGALTLNAPMKDVKDLFLDGRFVHNRNPLFEWYVNNVKLRGDYADKALGNWTPVKLGANRKIDGFMAFLDAHVIYMRKNPYRDAEIKEPEVAFYAL